MKHCVDVWVCYRIENGRAEIHPQPFTKDQARNFVRQSEKFGRNFRAAKFKIVMDFDTRLTPVTTR